MNETAEARIQALVAELRRRGFHHMYFVGRWGPVYKLRATGPRGRRVFLVVSSRTGRIIDRYPVRRRAWH